MNANVSELKSQAREVDALAPGETLLGECTDTDHDVMTGRVRVTWAHAGREHQAWLAVLAGAAVRVGDRVLVTRPANYDEPVVMGVLDGLETRRDTPAGRGPVLELMDDEAVRVHAHDGTPILEIQATDDGPTVRLLENQGRVVFPGKLFVQAEDIEFEATRGEVNITASGDVRVEGEVVRLN